MASLLTSDRLTRQRPIYWQYDQALKEKDDKLAPKYALREGDFKLLLSADFKSAALYNVKLDPAESTDVSHRELARVREMATSTPEN